MNQNSFDRWCGETFGYLLGMAEPPLMPSVVKGWSEMPAVGWELVWKELTQSLIEEAGPGFGHHCRLRGEALRTALRRQFAAVDRDTFVEVVSERIEIAHQARFTCNPHEDFWYFKINHGYWEQLYGIFGDSDPAERRFHASERYREAYIDSGFFAVLEKLFLKFAQDDGRVISFPGMHFGASLEAGNHNHETVLSKFPTLNRQPQRIALGTTISLLAVFESLYDRRSLSFADGSFPKLATLGGTLRDTLADFAHHSNRVVFVVPPHLQGVILDGVSIPQETLLIPEKYVHECWAIALWVTTKKVLSRLDENDRVLIITQSAVFSAMLGMFLRVAKEALFPKEKRIFFFDLGQVIDLATPDAGGVWITRNSVGDPSLFQISKNASSGPNA